MADLRINHVSVLLENGTILKCISVDLVKILAAALIFHGIGVYFGSKNAVRINQTLLKKGIAVFSICIAICKLFL